MSQVAHQARAYQGGCKGDPKTAKPHRKTLKTAISHQNLPKYDNFTNVVASVLDAVIVFLVHHSIRIMNFFI